MTCRSFASEFLISSKAFCKAASLRCSVSSDCGHGCRSQIVPTDDVAGFISQRHAAHQVPAVFSICSTDASFVREVFSTHEAGPPLSDDPIDVLRVNESRPLPSGYVVKRGAQVVQPRLIEVIDGAVGPGGVNQRRDRIDEKLNIQRLGLLFCRGHGGNHTPREIHSGTSAFALQQLQLRRPLSFAKILFTSEINNLQSIFSLSICYNFCSCSAWFDFSLGF